MVLVRLNELVVVVCGTGPWYGCVLMNWLWWLMILVLLNWDQLQSLQEKTAFAHINAFQLFLNKPEMHI